MVGILKLSCIMLSFAPFNCLEYISTLNPILILKCKDSNILTLNLLFLCVIFVFNLRSFTDKVTI